MSKVVRIHEWGSPEVLHPGDADSRAIIDWVEDGQPRQARWLSPNGSPPASRVMVADGTMTADEAYGLACQGTAILWRGDYQQARQILTALGRRADRRKPRAAVSAEAFHLYRQARSQRARTLNALLIELDDDYSIPLRRAPDVREACAEAFGPARTACVTSLRTLLGVIGEPLTVSKPIEFFPNT